MPENPASLKRALWRKAVARDSRWEKDELLTFVFYLRLLFALFSALIFGLIPLTGTSAILAYVMSTAILPTVVLRKYLRVRLESFGENMAWFCFTENLWPAFLLFVLIWTLVFTWRLTISKLPVSIA